MPYYSFNMKKGKYQVEMTSDDIYFAKRQVDKLFEKILKKQGKLRVVLPPIDAEKVAREAEELEKAKIIKDTAPEILSIKEEQKTEPTKPFKEPEKVAEIIEKAPELKKEVPTEKEEEIIETIQEEEDIVDETTSEPEEEEEEIISESEEEIEETILEETEEASQGSLFENILAEKTQEIEEAEEQETEEDEEIQLEQPVVKKKTFSFKNIISEKLKSSNNEEKPSRQKAGFKSAKIEEPEVKQIKIQDIISSEDEEDEEIAKILEEKIKKSLPANENKIVVEEESSEDEEDSLEIDEIDLSNQDFDSLAELIALKNPPSKLDYLLLTAYYLQTKENLFKYSLKQLNSKVMPILGSLIDHSIIHNAVSLNFIEVVPDYNGTAEVTEYRLTETGENYLLS